MKQYIMTYFGTVLSVQNDILHQMHLRMIHDKKQCVSIDSKNFREVIIRHNNKALSPTNENSSICNDLFQINFLSHAIITLKKGDFYLCSLPENGFSTPSDSLALRTEQNAWETFRLIPKKQLKNLIFLQRNGFLLHGKHYIFKASTLNHMAFISDEMGEKIIPYENFFSSFSKKDLSFTFFQDGYPYFAKIYNPCVLYILFGSGEIREQFIISVKSLVKIGNYHGHILIVTDNDGYVINNIMRKIDFYNYSIIRKNAFDRTDMVNMRLDFIGKNSSVKQFQPLFYLDCDILIINKIDALLKNALYCKNPSAQIEKFNTLKNSPSTGGTLYQASPFPSENICGFNAGILLLPSGPKYQDLFCTAYTMATYHAIQHGRDSVPFFDQSILNYVLYKSDNFAAEPITSATALEPETVTEHTLFIHFWKFAPRKAKEMKKYLAHIQNKSSQS